MECLLLDIQFEDEPTGRETNLLQIPVQQAALETSVDFRIQTKATCSRPSSAGSSPCLWPLPEAAMFSRKDALSDLLEPIQRIGSGDICRPSGSFFVGDMFTGGKSTGMKLIKYMGILASLVGRGCYPRFMTGSVTLHVIRTINFYQAEEMA